MFKRITRLLCLIISFQLFVGCNSSMLAIDGAGGSFFAISGLIVQSLKRANDTIFPSAVAAAVATGEVIVYTVDESNYSVEIGRHTLYDGVKEFNFKVDKELVNKDILFFKYSKIGAEDRREKFEILPIDSNEIYTELDAESTFKADIIKHKINEAVASNKDYKDVQQMIQKFDLSKYAETIKKQFGSYEKYLAAMKSSELGSQAGAIFAENPKPGEDDIITLTLAADAAEKLATKLKCETLSTPEIEDSSKEGTVEVYLSFKTTDAATKDLGFNDYNIAGPAKSEYEANIEIAYFLFSLSKAADEKGQPMTGYLIAHDKMRDLTTACKVTIDPAP